MGKENENRELARGEKVRIYVVVRRASGGGHGTLYKVHHHVLQESFYALKVLHASLRDNATIVTRMAREAQILSTLQHENIVEVFDTGMTDEMDLETGASLARPFIAMEWLKGRTLAYVLSSVRHRGVGLHPALHIGIEMADALDHAHSRNVIHRDVKPENIFLQFAEGRPNSTRTKLLDFGIARLLGAQKITMREQMVGTALYASPEQARGEDPTAQTDVYAFGLVFYEMLIGRHPFEHAIRGSDMYPMLQAHISEKPATLSIHDVPAPLVRLVMSCLEKEPRFRPASMAAIGRELREFFNNLDAQTRADLASLSKTDPTPVQNAVTQGGSEVTDPGPPPAMSPGPAQTAPDAPAALRHRDDPHQPIRETRQDGVAAGNTLRMAVGDHAPTYVPPTQTPIDRAAMTRSAQAVPAVLPRTGTQPTARTPPTAPRTSARDRKDERFRAVGDKVLWIDDADDQGSRPPRPNSSTLSSAEQSTTSSAGAVAMIRYAPAPIPTPPGVRRTIASLAAAAAGVVFVAMGVVAFALVGPHVHSVRVPATSAVPEPSVEGFVVPAPTPPLLSPSSPTGPSTTTIASTPTAPTVLSASPVSHPTPAAGSGRPSRPRQAPAARPHGGDLPDDFKTTFR